MYFKDSYNCFLKYLLNPRQSLGLCHHVPCNMTLLIHRLYSAFCSCLGNTWILNISVLRVQPIQAAGQRLTESMPALQCMSNPQTCMSGISSCVPYCIVTPCLGPWLYNTSKVYCLSLEQTCLLSGLSIHSEKRLCTAPLLMHLALLSIFIFFYLLENNKLTYKSG